MTSSIRELMLAGAHFGHRARFWSPKMSAYIFGKYHSTHIINLDETLIGLSRAADFLKSTAAGGGTVLFLCTKKAGADSIAAAAKRVDMPYVDQRWLGGILTNFKTTRNSVGSLQRIEEEIELGALRRLTKKEGIKLILAKDKLNAAIGGIRDMTDLPDALFVIDAGWHKGAIREANKLGIPVVAVVDTNHSPEGIDYVIPGNDDSRQAIAVYAREIAAAIGKGKDQRRASIGEPLIVNAPALPGARFAPPAAAKPAANRAAADKPKGKVVKAKSAAADKPADKAEDKPAAKPAAKTASKPAAKKPAAKAEAKAEAKADAKGEAKTATKKPAAKAAAKPAAKPAAKSK